MAHIVVCPACDTRIVSATVTDQCPHCCAAIESGGWKQIKTDQATGAIPRDQVWDEVAVREQAPAPRSLAEFFRARGRKQGVQTMEIALDDLHPKAAPPPGTPVAPPPESPAAAALRAIAVGSPATRGPSAASAPTPSTAPLPAGDARARIDTRQRTLPADAERAITPPPVPPGLRQTQQRLPAMGRDVTPPPPPTAAGVRGEQPVAPIAGARGTQPLMPAAVTPPPEARRAAPDGLDEHDDLAILRGPRRRGPPMAVLTTLAVVVAVGAGWFLGRKSPADIEAKPAPPAAASSPAPTPAEPPTAATPPAAGAARVPTTATPASAAAAIPSPSPTTAPPPGPADPPTPSAGEKPVVAEKPAGAKPAPNPESKPKPVQRDPAAAKALNQEGLRMLFAGDAGGAVDKFKVALKADPGLAQAHRGLGLAYSKLGDARNAKKHFEKYLKANPNASDAESIRKKIEEL